MAKIFISYSRKDTDQVDFLIKLLESANHDVWVDTQDIRAGSQWQTSIVQGIVESDFFIIALSKNSAKSDNVRRELVIAVNHKKEIIPVCIQEVELPPEMQYQLAGIQRINFDKDSQKDRVALLSVLDKEGSDVQRKLTIPRVQPSSKNRILWLALAFFALVSLIVVTTLYGPDSEGIQLLSISITEKDASPKVELDIKLINNGDKARLHTASIHLQGHATLDIGGCLNSPPGGGGVQPGGGSQHIPVSETYKIDISDLDEKENKSIDDFFLVMENDSDNQFVILLNTETNWNTMILYKTNLQFIYHPDDQMVISSPFIFTSKNPDQTFSEKFIYGYNVSDNDILKKYFYLVEGEQYSEEELISIVRGCFDKNRRATTEFFSGEPLVSEQDMSKQGKIIYSEWKKVMEDTP